MAPRDPILGLNRQYAANTNPAKVNLGVGVYYDDAGKYAAAQVRSVGRKTADGKTHRAGYLPIDGIAAYDKAVQGPGVPGADSAIVKGGRVATVQALGGTGGLKIGADFIKRINPTAKVLISDPSWGEPPRCSKSAGFVVENYPTTTPPSVA